MRAWAVFLGGALLCAALQWGGERVFLALRYERNALLDGQLWRALTGNLVHVSWAHLGVNLAVAAALTAALGRYLRWQAVLLCGLGVSAGLFLFCLRLRWYAGLSGLLHGLLAFGALEAWRASRRRVWLVLLGLLAGKLILEEVRSAPESLEALIGARVVVEAHLFGALTGALCVALLWRRPVSRAGEGS